jgi:hypothetical protein
VHSPEELILGRALLLRRPGGFLPDLFSSKPILDGYGDVGIATAVSGGIGKK